MAEGAKEALGAERHVLDPVERISEILFGLIMVLTFTCTIEVAQMGTEETKDLLLAALGCNFAWGVIDAVMYLMSTLAERARQLIAQRSIHAAVSADRAREAARAALPPIAAASLDPAALDKIVVAVKAAGEPPHHASLGFQDWRAAFGVFLLVFFSTLPVALPFLFFENVQLALRLSNGIAIVMLFALGYAYGQHLSHRPWRSAIAMVVMGVALVAIAIAFGG